MTGPKTGASLAPTISALIVNACSLSKLALVAALLLGCGRAPEPLPFKPVADMKLLMKAMLEPDAGVIANALGATVTENGEEKPRPPTDGQALASTPGAAPAIALGSIDCLWACERSCTVQLRSPGRMGYMLGALEPGAEAARILLAFAALYCESEDGVVLYPRWPAGLHRENFLCRVPPATAGNKATGI